MPRINYFKKKIACLEKSSINKEDTKYLLYLDILQCYEEFPPTDAEIHSCVEATVLRIKMEIMKEEIKKKEEEKKTEEEKLKESTEKAKILIKELQDENIERTLSYKTLHKRVKRTWHLALLYLDGIRKEGLELIKLKHTIDSLQTPFLRDFEKTKIWKLFIDANRHPFSEFSFDIDEPGYIGALFESFNYALQYEGELTPEYIAKIHDLSIKDVKLYNNNDHDIEKVTHDKTGFGEKNKDKIYWNWINILESNMTKKGINELEEKILNIHPCPYSNTLNNWCTLISNKKTTHENSRRIENKGQNTQELIQTERNTPKLKPMIEQIAEPEIQLEALRFVLEKQRLINKKEKATAQLIIFGDNIKRIKQTKRLIEAYYQEREEANTPEKKQIAIVRFIQNLDQSHVFLDGNIRTFAFVLMNTLLIKDGMSPVIWDNPNILDGHTLTECLEHVRNGQETFKRELSIKESFQNPILN